MFTDTTWEDFPAGFGPDRRSWEINSDLATQLADSTGLNKEQALLLVSFTNSGLPITLTWEQWLPGLGKTEITTATGVVTLLRAPGHDQYDEIEFHYPGFGPKLMYRQIVRVSYPETTHTYR